MLKVPWVICWAVFLLQQAEAKLLAAGLRHTCFVQSDQTLFCFGQHINTMYSQATASAPFPAPVLGAHNVTDVSSGDDFTCFIGDGLPQCFGNNDNGQLGDGTTVNRARPSLVIPFTRGLAGYQIQAGHRHVCSTAGSATHPAVLHCWGLGSSGQLGNNNTVDLFFAPTVARINHTMIGPKTISAGAAHTCVATLTGEVYCTGSNLYGQLGDGTFTNRSVFTQVTVLGSNVLGTNCGAFHSCAVLNDYNVACWGSNSHGQLGNPRFAQSNFPVFPTGFQIGSGVFVGSGMYNTFVIHKESRNVTGFGDNSCGQLGTGDLLDYNTPQVFNHGARPIAEVRSGLHHVCVMFVDGQVACLGCDPYGQLGTGLPLANSTALLNVTYATLAPSSSPVLAPTLSPTKPPTKPPILILTIPPTKPPILILTIPPTKLPTPSPTLFPTHNPTLLPTPSPTLFPTSSPTLFPTQGPSPPPFSTGSPSATPTISMPTFSPTLFPTLVPTLLPTLAPTLFPTFAPTFVPPLVPTFAPTLTPTPPTFDPIPPTSTPAPAPTAFMSTPSPTLFPTHEPTRLTLPTPSPTSLPTISPTLFPTFSPTLLPTVSPTLLPIVSPTSPTQLPTTKLPTKLPTRIPTKLPTLPPSFAPSFVPSAAPTRFPSTSRPSFTPTLSPAVTTLTPTLSPAVTTRIPTLSPAVVTNRPTAGPTPSLRTNT
ncbi:hypothetical protein BASA81_004764 [Batrachochytrium salamandrivorans]|nr:hypothetical protein BASA81_004764 [Batrachochytrium salamandrivorans]